LIIIVCFSRFLCDPSDPFFSFILNPSSISSFFYIIKVGFHCKFARHDSLLHASDCIIDRHTSNYYFYYYKHNYNNKKKPRQKTNWLFAEIKSSIKYRMKKLITYRQNRWLETGGCIIALKLAVNVRVGGCATAWRLGTHGHTQMTGGHGRHGRRAGPVHTQPTHLTAIGEHLLIGLWKVILVATTASANRVLLVVPVRRVKFLKCKKNAWLYNFYETL
jgi:hypothetical protein